MSFAMASASFITPDREVMFLLYLFVCCLFICESQHNVLKGFLENRVKAQVSVRKITGNQVSGKVQHFIFCFVAFLHKDSQ